MSEGFDRLPIRVRLAGVSALLTFVILCAFAIAIGSLTVHRIRADFNREVPDAAIQLPSQLRMIGSGCRYDHARRCRTLPRHENHVVIRILTSAAPCWRSTAEGPARSACPRKLRGTSTAIV